MNDAISVPIFDPIKHQILLGIGAFALLFGLSLLVAVRDKANRVNQTTLQVILAQVIILPSSAYVMIWAHQHPEYLNDRPDAYLYDMRLFLPLVAVFEVLVVAYVIRSRQSPVVKALRLMKRAHELLAEGRVEEADAAYAEGRSILDRKCKRHSRGRDGPRGSISDDACD
jgi:hypothetical protein